nr:hypothetical protein [uncultured Psychroserpens sp.]
MVEGDYNSSISQTIKINKYEKFIDTILIPKIRFTTESTLHSSYWNYFNCDKICNGKEIDYYSNGNKRLEGIFEKGKPIEITQFREDGIVETKNYYYLRRLNIKRREYYDSKGKLEEYELHKLKKSKIVIKTYDSKGELLKKEIEKYNF